MRTLTTITMLLCVYIATMSQELGFLKSQHIVNVTFNYEEAIIHGLTVDDFETYEQDWNRDQPKLYGKFMSNFNHHVKKFFIGGSKENTKYIIEVRPVFIDENGNIHAYYVVLNQAGGVLYRSKKIYGEGGRIGSKLNLIGDGMESLGNAIGGDVTKRLK